MFLNKMVLESGCWEVIVLQAEEKIQDPSTWGYHKKEKKKPVLIPAAIPPFFPVQFLFIKNTFHHERESRCGHLLPVSQVSSGILVT